MDTARAITKSLRRTIPVGPIGPRLGFTVAGAGPTARTSSVCAARLRMQTYSNIGFRLALSSGRPLTSRRAADPIKTTAD